MGESALAMEELILKLVENTGAAAAWSGYAASWILLVADSIVLPVMVRVEERELLDRYGKEFADYMRRVPRFFV